MIPKAERIINQLLGTVYTDKKDPTVFRISMDNALKILSNNDYVLPNRQYEMQLENLLNKKLVGTEVQAHTRYSIARGMLALADEMAVSKEDVLSYSSLSKDDIVKKG